MNEKSQNSKAQQRKGNSENSEADKGKDRDLNYSSKFTEESAGLTPDENQKPDEPQGDKDE